MFLLLRICLFLYGPPICIFLMTYELVLFLYFTAWTLLQRTISLSGDMQYRTTFGKGK
jgi:hypothetical protein